MRICQQLAVIGLFLLLSAPAASQVLLPTGVVVSADKMRNADEACDAKIADACLAIGFAEYRGMGRMVDMVKATAAFQKACELGSGAGCEYFAAFIDQVDSPPDAETKAKALKVKASEIYQTKCDQRAFAACHSLAELLAAGSSASDKARAIQFYSKSCFELNYGLSCARGAQLVNKPGTATYDEDLANRMTAAVEPAFETECRNGVIGSCEKLAEWIVEERGENEASYLAELAQQACSGGVAGGCLRAASIAQKMDQGQAGWDRQFSFMEAACNLLLGTCDELADLMRRPRAGRQFDPDEIFRTDMRACVGGIDSSCIEVLKIAGPLTSENGSAVITAFDHICLRGHYTLAEFCTAAARNHLERAKANPATSAADRAEAANLYRRALVRTDDIYNTDDAHGEARAFLSGGT